MTKAEFVRISTPEQDYGQSNLLNAQLELLNLVKSFHKYKVLRGEELVLKVSLKSKIGETLEAIDKLDKLLPKASYNSPTPGDREKNRHERERSLSLQGEIERVREKLDKLQEGF